MRLKVGDYNARTVALLLQEELVLHVHVILVLKKNYGGLYTMTCSITVESCLHIS